jgi:hypothetical protein
MLFLKTNKQVFHTLRLFGSWNRGLLLRLCFLFFFFFCFFLKKKIIIFIPMRIIIPKRCLFHTILLSQANRHTLRFPESMTHLVSPAMATLVGCISVCCYPSRPTDTHTHGHIPKIFVITYRGHHTCSVVSIVVHKATVYSLGSCSSHTCWLKTSGQHDSATGRDVRLTSLRLRTKFLCVFFIFIFYYYYGDAVRHWQSHPISHRVPCIPLCVSALFLLFFSKVGRAHTRTRIHAHTRIRIANCASMMEKGYFLVLHSFVLFPGAVV